MSKDRLLGFFGDRFHKNVFLFCVVASIGLIIASFVLPPLGIIDSSVLPSFVDDVIEAYVGFALGTYPPYILLNDVI